MSPVQSVTYLSGSDLSRMAEGAGFEPAIRFWRIHTFQACAFNHSATPPDCLRPPESLSESGARPFWKAPNLTEGPSGRKQIHGPPGTRNPGILHVFHRVEDNLELSTTNRRWFVVRTNPESTVI